MKKVPFLIQISKVHISICYITELQDLEISATKMTVFSIMEKQDKKERQLRFFYCNYA